MIECAGMEFTHFTACPRPETAPCSSARTRQSVAHGVRGTWNASADAADSVLPRSGAAQAALARAAQDCETASCSNATTWGAVDLSKGPKVRLCHATSSPARSRA